MTDFYKSDTYLIVQKMKAGGNSPGVIELWKSMVEHWAKMNVGNPADVAAVRSWLPLWQARGGYTSAELAPIWPMLAIALGIRRNVMPIKSPNRLANELKFARLPYRDAPNGKTYFIVERVGYWSRASDEEFAREVLGG